jgi:hypothetical protein
MEQWEHLKFLVQQSGGARQFVIDPWLPDVRLPEPSDSNVVKVLNDLGSLGWQLVSVDAAEGTYWMKRRVPESDGVPHTSFGL